MGKAQHFSRRISRVHQDLFENMAVVIYILDRFKSDPNGKVGKLPAKTIALASVDSYFGLDEGSPAVSDSFDKLFKGWPVENLLFT